MQATEKVLPTDKKVKDTYSRYFAKSKYQIPLLKYIQHTDYEIFIGVPYRVTIQDLKNATQDYSISSDSNTFFHSYDCKNAYLCEYAVNKGKQGMIYIAIRCINQERCALICTETALSKRLITKHHE